jgi:orotidine-5'-phosphate decarboxylase
MRVGIDLDDTITEAPFFFRIIAKGLMADGHEVYIITFREDLNLAIQDLKKYDIPYTNIFVPEQNDKSPEKWKAKIAIKLGLDIMVDDSPEVLDAMPKNVKTIWFCDRNVFSLETCIMALKAAPKIGMIN